jgi:2-dehydro-3-deoxyphosphogluconate aldolase / (4S)-4-hydroxy-2-oxoglutarate aldolase
MNIREVTALSPVIPVLTISDLRHAVPLARALYTGGLPVLEVTLRSTVALAAIRAIRDEVPEVLVGAGTLTRAVDFAAAEKVGAQFGATPGLTPTLAKAARDVGFPLLPGVMTPSEVMTARDCGFSVLKWFPAIQASGSTVLQLLAGPFPDVLFCPTGGISRATASGYLALSNVPCVGGSWVAPPAMIGAEDWTSIENLARDAASLANPKKIDRSH